jgi:hypothetical protein
MLVMIRESGIIQPHLLAPRVLLAAKNTRIALLPTRNPSELVSARKTVSFFVRYCSIAYACIE